MPSKVDVDAQVETKPEVKADAGLLELYKKLEQNEAQVLKASSAARTILVQVVDYVRKNNVSREVVKATLAERGLTKDSIDTELTRIWALSKDTPKATEIFEKLKTNQITQRQARQMISKPQLAPARLNKPEQSVQTKVHDHLVTGAKIAYADLVKDDPNRFFENSGQFLEIAKTAWAEVEKVYTDRAAEKKAKIEGSAGNGEDDVPNEPTGQS